MDLFNKKKSPGFVDRSPPVRSKVKSTIPAHSSAGYTPGYPSAPFLLCNDDARFPVGTPPEVVRSFKAVDANRNGFIDEWELQRALAFTCNFSIRTVRFLMFLFKNPLNTSGMGPSEFAELWNCLGQWQFVFEKYDRDGSGTIDSDELQNIFHDIGYAIPASVIDMIVSRYNTGKRSKGSLEFDQFVESITIVRGLTEEFKQKDERLTGSATFTYDTFLSMLIQFIVP